MSAAELEFPFCGFHLLIEEKKRQAVWDASYGLVIWNAAFALCALFENPSSIGLKAAAFGPDTNILELGAGCGLVGIALAKAYGARVLLTDYEPRVIQGLERNVLINGLKTVDVKAMDWADITLPESDVDWDHIIAADLLYNDTELLYPDLARMYPPVDSEFCLPNFLS